MKGLNIDQSSGILVADDAWTGSENDAIDARSVATINKINNGAWFKSNVANSDISISANAGFVDGVGAPTNQCQHLLNLGAAMSRMETSIDYGVEDAIMLFFYFRSTSALYSAGDCIRLRVKLDSSYQTILLRLDEITGGSASNGAETSHTVVDASIASPLIITDDGTGFVVNYNSGEISKTYTTTTHYDDSHRHVGLGISGANAFCGEIKYYT